MTEDELYRRFSEELGTVATGPDELLRDSGTLGVSRST